MRKLFIAFAVLCLSTAAIAQSGHSVTINTTASAPGTATVLRANGSCPTSGVPSSGTTLTSSLAVPTAGTAVPYKDSTVVDGNTYCYWVTYVATGGGSAVSNTFLGAITVTVQISGQVN